MPDIEKTLCNYCGSQFLVIFEEEEEEADKNDDNDNEAFDDAQIIAEEAEANKQKKD